MSIFRHLYSLASDLALRTGVHASVFIAGGASTVAVTGAVAVYHHVSSPATVTATTSDDASPTAAADPSPAAPAVSSARAAVPVAHNPATVFGSTGPAQPSSPSAPESSGSSQSAAASPQPVAPQLSGAIAPPPGAPPTRPNSGPVPGPNPSPPVNGLPVRAPAAAASSPESLPNATGSGLFSVGGPAAGAALGAGTASTGSSGSDSPGDWGTPSSSDATAVTLGCTPLSFAKKPPNALYPIDGNTAVPLTQGATGATTFTTLAQDTCDTGTLTYTCTYTTPGIVAPDPNSVSVATSCTSLPSLATSASGVVAISAASFTNGVLSWWPTSLQRGTFAFTITATNTSTTNSISTSFEATVRENFATPASLHLALDAQVAASVSGLSSTISAGPASTTQTEWIDLYSALSTPTLAGATWSGNGTGTSPYSASFAGSAGEHLSLGSILNSDTTLGFGAWVNPTSVATAGSVILGNLGASTNDSGLALKQSDTNSGRVELQLGGGPTYTASGTTYAGYPAIILGDGPLAYWRLGNTASTTSIADLSGNSHTGTASGVTFSGTSALTGDATTSAAFSPSGAITAAYATALTGLSMEFWAELPSLPGNTPFAMQLRSAGGYNAAVYLTSAHWYAYAWDTGGKSVTGPAPTAGQFSHVVLTVANSGNLYLYVNGVQYGPTAFGTLATGYTTLQIAGYNSAFTSYFGGSLQDVAFYNYALSSGQVTAHFNAGKAKFYANPILAAQPQGYWRMGESGGSVAYDLSANGYTGTYASTGVTLGASGPYTKDSVTSATLDGAHGNVATANDSTALSGTNMSIVAWIDPTSVGTAQAFVGARTATTDTWAFYVRPTGQLGFTLNGTGDYNSSAAGLTAGSFQHVAAVVNGQSLTIYRNGTNVYSTTMAADVVHTAYPIYIGSANGNPSSPFAGSIADVAIFNYALTPQQIANIHASGAFTKCLSSTTLSNNAWSFISGLWDGTNLELFMNGQMQCKLQPTNLYGTPSTNLDVAAAISGGADANNWAGQVADMKIYGTTSGAPLTAAEIQSDFVAEANRFRSSTSLANPAPAAVPDLAASGLVLNLDAANSNAGVGPFYSGAAGDCATAHLDWQDLSSSNLLGGLFGFSGCGAAQGWVGNGSQANPYALAFNGTSDIVNLGSPTALELGGPVTLETWFESALPGTEVGIAGMGYASAYQLDYYSDGKLYAYVGGGGGNYVSKSITAGAWHHVVFTWDGTTNANSMNLYVDSAAAVTHTSTVGSVSSWGPFYVGYITRAGGYFGGKVGAVRLYNSVLSYPAVRQNCNAMASRYGITCN